MSKHLPYAIDENTGPSVLEVSIADAIREFTRSVLTAGVQDFYRGTADEHEELTIGLRKIEKAASLLSYRIAYQAQQHGADFGKCGLPTDAGQDLFDWCTWACSVAASDMREFGYSQAAE